LKLEKKNILSICFILEVVKGDKMLCLQSALNLRVGSMMRKFQILQILVVNISQTLIHHFIA